MEFSRKTYLDRLIEQKHNGLVKILTGIHGCGKSYLLRKLFRDYLIKSGVDPDHICVYEFPRSSDRSMCSPDVFFADLKKRLPETGRCYLLLDDVEYLSDAAQVLNSLNCEDHLDVYVTGSHASGSATDVSTVFRGRGDVVYVFPLSLPNLCPALTVVFTRRGRNIPATAECRRWSPWSRKKRRGPGSRAFSRTRVWRTWLVTMTLARRVNLRRSSVS